MNTENPDNKQKQRKVLPLAYLMCSRPLKPNFIRQLAGDSCLNSLH